MVNQVQLVTDTALADLIEVFVLNPIDLVVSKIARFSGPDAADIEALIHTFQLSAADI